MQTVPVVRSAFEITRQTLQKAWPYLLMAILPGGSLVAAMLYLYRRYARA